MSDLAASSCEACRIDAPIVSDDEASLLIKEIEGWHLINDGVKKLKKEFNFSCKFSMFSNQWTNLVRRPAI